MKIPGLQVFLALLLCAAARGDWPTVRGGAARTGHVDAPVRPPFRVAWVRHFAGERMSSALEPVTAGGKVYVATHSGSLHALDAASGEPLWRYQARGAFLHSPAVSGGIVVAASVDGPLHAIDAVSGRPRWSVFLAPGGCAASPLILDGVVFIGTRAGDLAALDLSSGESRWRLHLGAPVRQTAAGAGGRVFVVAEDLRARCLDARTGAMMWTSTQLEGQSARDYYPVIAEVAGSAAGARGLVAVRTSPAVNMAQRIARDRQVLAGNAGVDGGDWRQLDGWTKSEAARGRPELWEREQKAIARHIEAEPEARTFFLLDAGTGKEAMAAPVLWSAGCQGTGTPPVALPDGRLIVLWRSAYGHWSLGVAPLVALGILDPAVGRVAVLEHQRGPQPPWNTFWGTADESQNFTVAGKTLLIVHQSTVSGLDLESGDLFPIAGERDSWGGFRNLPWARNEWNGPGRGSVAVDGSRFFWQTGSRIECIVSGADAQNAAPAGAAARAVDVEIDGGRVPTSAAPESQPGGRSRLADDLARAVEETLSRRWAPLCFEPGLAGREFPFDSSGDLFEALALAFPHLAPELKTRVKAFLREEWEQYPPFTRKGWYRLDDGERREHHRVPAASLSRLHRDPPYHPFGNLHPVLLYVERLDEWERIRSAWRGIRAAFDEFVAMGWRLAPEKGDLHANRYLGSLIAFERLAEAAGDQEAAACAKGIAEAAASDLVAWWSRSAERITLPVIKDIREWDAFIGAGDVLFFKVVPHKAKVALFHTLTPEVAARVKARAPGAAEKVWRTFESLCPTWHLAGEERQVHYGENFADPPDFSLDAFRALAWLRDAPAVELERRVDLPFCKADLGWIVKLAIALDGKAPGDRPK